MPSVLAKLDTDLQIPLDEDAIKSGDPERLLDYLRELTGTLQDLFETVTLTANYTIDLADGAAVYYALKNKEGVYPVGTWRTRQVGDNLVHEFKSAAPDTWTVVKTTERPI